MTPAEMNALIQLIIAHQPSALASLQQLPTCAWADDLQQTPLNAAIAANNTLIIEYLISRKECLNFAPPQPSDIKMAVKYSAEGLSLKKGEEKLRQSFGARVSWQRTGLLEACRQNNRNAIALLLAQGDKPTAKDVFGFGPIDLCYESGGEPLVEFFIERCVALKKPYPVSDVVIWKFLNNPIFLDKILQQARLTIEAKREIFAFACATLNQERVLSLLQNGYNLNKMFGPVSGWIRAAIHRF